MSIRVTCSGCHSRFNVSEKFAGKSGPCPKCKKLIQIPGLDEEVRIFEPESYGPKGGSGEAVLRPVFRRETAVSPVQIALIVSAIAAFLAIALIIRLMVPDKAAFSDVIEWLLGLIIAFPVAFAGYTFLRDSELAPFQGNELWGRIAGCAVVYGLLWFCMYLASLAFADRWETPTWISGFVVMLILGAATATLALNFDFLTGLLHYGFYLVTCIFGRWLAGLGALPGMLQEPEAPGGAIAPEVAMHVLSGLWWLSGCF